MLLLGGGGSDHRVHKVLVVLEHLLSALFLGGIHFQSFGILTELIKMEAKLFLI